MCNDRKEIVKIFSTMFDNVDKHGIYPTSTAYMQLEHYIQQERNIAIGCTHGACCLELDKGNDPRTVDCSGFVADIHDKLKNDSSTLFSSKDKNIEHIDYVIPGDDCRPLDFYEGEEDGK